MSKGLMKKKLNEIKSFVRTFRGRERKKKKKKSSLQNAALIHSMPARREAPALAFGCGTRQMTRGGAFRIDRFRGYYSGTRASVGQKVLNWQRRAAPFC